MILDDLKRTVARTSGARTPAGTAFLVSPTHALTCAHCAIETDGGGVADRLTLYFSLWDGDREVEATVDAVDLECDAALLRLARPAPVAVGPRSRRATNGAAWQSFVHPNPTGNTGIVIGGVVVDRNARTGQAVARAVIQLRCHEAHYSLHGASGGPVLADGRIVGIIANQAKMWGRSGADGGRGAVPAYDALFAVPMAAIVASPALRARIAWFDDDDAEEVATPAPPPAPPTEAVLLRRYVQIIESVPKLTSVKVPGSGGAIETVPLDSLYVEPAIAGLANLDELWSRQRVAVVAEEGMGRVALLKHLDLRLLRNPGIAGDPPLWPLYVELDRFAARGGDRGLTAFALDDLLGPDGDPALRTQIETCDRENRLVLLCDGLERVGADYERVIDALSRQRRFVVGVRAGRRVDVGQESGATLRLQPFDRQRIVAFVGNWARTIAPRRAGFDAQRLCQDLADPGALRELAQTPRFLALICAVTSDGGALVPTRAALVAAAWESVWNTTLGGATFARRRTLGGVLEGLARRSYEGRAGAKGTIGEEELYEALERAGERDADELVARLVECEILALADTSSYAARSFRFSIASFETYLAACHFANDPAFLAALPRLALDRRSAAILPFVAGILGRNATRLPLRDFLAAVAALPSGEAFGLHVCLVADCLAEVPPAVAASLADVVDGTAMALLDAWTNQILARKQVVGTFRRLQPSGVRDRLLARVSDAAQPVDQRAAATFALSAFRDRATQDALTTLCAKGETAEMRAAACVGLFVRDPDQAGPFLVAALRDPDLIVRVAAAQCIARAGNRGLATGVIDAWLAGIPLDQGIDNDLLRVQSTVSWGSTIVTLRPEATLPLLLDAITEGEPAERQFALFVMVEARLRAAVWPAIDVLGDPAKENPERQLAAQVLTRIGTEAARHALRQAFARGDVAAKQGATEGAAIDEQLRSSPLADFILDPGDARFSWSFIRPLQEQTLAARAAEIRQSLQPAIAKRGLDAVLADARSEFARDRPEPSVLSGLVDVVNQFAHAVGDSEDGLRRVGALNVIHTLKADPELLAEALFDGDAMVALLAAVLLRLGASQEAAASLLARLDAAPRDGFSLPFWAAVFALARPSHLTLLVERYRAGSRTAGSALWQLCLEYGLRYYADDRLEFPDGQIETDCETAAERLRQLDRATARAPDAEGVEASLAFEGAKREYATALSMAPADAAGWASRAVVATMLGKTDLAIAALDQAIATDGGSGLWHKLRGGVRAGAGALAAAADDFARAIELGRDGAVDYAGLGDLRFNLKQADAAAAAYDIALDKDPSLRVARYRRAVVQFIRGSYADALADLDVLLAEHPADAEAAELRASAKCALGRYADCAGDLAVIDAANAGSLIGPAPEMLLKAYLWRARDALARGRLDAAFTDAKRVILAQALHPVARVLRARVWVEQGHPDFAIIDLVDLASHLASSESRAALVSALQELVELRGVAAAPRDAKVRADALGVRGTLLTTLGQGDAARVDLEQAIAGGSTDWRMRNSLAWLYSDHFGERLEEATLLAQAAVDGAGAGAVDRDFDRATAWDTLGWTYHKRGLRAEAKAAFERALERAPGNEEITAHLRLAAGEATALEDAREIPARNYPGPDDRVRTDPGQDDPAG